MIRLLVIDDSAVMRRIVGTIFDAPGFELAFARSGEEALPMLQSFRPDVITLDVVMPGMDGLACLGEIMRLRPCPVLMLSSLTAAGKRDAVEAMARGAVDVIAKPQGPLSPDLEPLASELTAKVRTAATARVHAPAASRRTAPPPATGAAPLSAGTRFPVVLLGASTGGPPALYEILSTLMPNFPAAIVICQHMPANFTGPLAARLDRNCALPVDEVDTDRVLHPGRVYIGRGDADLVLRRGPGGLAVHSVPGDPSRPWHPSTDRLVESAMEATDPRRLVGVLVTGMGCDGAASMTRLRERGGRTLAEAESTATVWGMPRALVEMGGADRVVALPQIAAAMADMLSRRQEA